MLILPAAAACPSRIFFIAALSSHLLLPIDLLIVPFRPFALASVVFFIHLIKPARRMRMASINPFFLYLL